jgi:hypothetical protein
MQRIINRIEADIKILVNMLKTADLNKTQQIQLVEVIETLRGRLDSLMMIDVKYLVRKAKEGNERSERTLIKRYGKVITQELFEELS